MILVVRIIQKCWNRLQQRSTSEPEHPVEVSPDATQRYAEVQAQHNDMIRRLQMLQANADVLARRSKDPPKD